MACTGVLGVLREQDKIRYSDKSFSCVIEQTLPRRKKVCYSLCAVKEWKRRRKRMRRGEERERKKDEGKEEEGKTQEGNVRSFLPLL